MLMSVAVSGATILQTPSNASSSNSLGVVKLDQCNKHPDWIGDGILKSDCQAAVRELYNDDVVPRQGQEYEFLTRGVTRQSYLPWVTTPRKHWYGE